MDGAMDYLVINGWQAHITFSASHIIPDYVLCGRLHGHTYAIHARIYGRKDKNGIIIDFGKLKDKLRSEAEKLDHKMLIPSRSRKVEVVADSVRIKMGKGKKEYIFPKEDCAMLDIDSSSAENISQYILDKIKEWLPENINRIEIGVDEGLGQGAWSVWERKEG